MLGDSSDEVGVIAPVSQSPVNRDLKCIPLSCLPPLPHQHNMFLLKCNMIDY